MQKAIWTHRYGWHLKDYNMEKDLGTCKNCEHGCHCGNSGSCTSCECKNCEHKSYEANNA